MCVEYVEAVYVENPFLQICMVTYVAGILQYYLPPILLLIVLEEGLDKYNHYSQRDHKYSG